MKSAHQLSIATLVMAGFIATGCSQQQVTGSGGSQVAGGSQQVAGGSQVQTAPVPEVKTVIKYKTKTVIKEVCRAKCAKPATPRAQSGHFHPANRCTKSVRHNHKFNNPRHTHRYSCQGKSPSRPQYGHAHRAIPGCTNSFRHNHKFNSARHSHKYGCRSTKRTYRAPAKRYNKWTHAHPANRCTKSIRHTHKFQNRSHSHRYSCQGQARPQPQKVHVPNMQPKAPVDVHALQRKLKAKGYYKGPIDGIVGSGTRGALQRFMQNRR
jgi:hypothetical protein